MMLPLRSVIHTHTHTVFCKVSHQELNTILTHGKQLHAHSLVCTTPECMYLPYIWQELRAERGRREDVVQYSLVDVAGHYAELQGVLIYYGGQWSMKSWRRAERAQIPFLHPHAAHLSPQFPALPAPVFLTAHHGPAQPRPCLRWALAPSMRLARLPSCRGSAVVSVGLEGCLPKVNKIRAWAWPRYDGITSL